MAVYSNNEVKSFLSGERDTFLFEEANRVQNEFCGDRIFIRGLLEFSSFCNKNCLYCGLRRDNREIVRYRLSREEILAAVSEIHSRGINTVVLQSGDDLSFSRKLICSIIGEIRKRYPGMAITLSVGERPMGDYQAFYDCGADRYLLKVETMNKKLYSFMHPGQSLSKRVMILEHLKKIGFQTGSGNIIGLPYQSENDLAEDIMFLSGFPLDMIGVGPFIAQEHTSFREEASPRVEKVRRFLALLRLTTKNAHIPATTALATLAGDQEQVQALIYGCNVLMVNFTPGKYREDYCIYDNKYTISLDKAVELTRKASRAVCFDRGDSLKPSLDIDGTG